MSSTLNGFISSNKGEEEEEAVFMSAMQLASASAINMALRTVIELDVLEIIAKAGPGVQLSPSEISSLLPTQNPDAPAMLDRILCLLARYCILTCSLVTNSDGQVQRLYGLAPICKFLVRNEDGVSLSPFLMMNSDKDCMEPLYYLKDTILEGGNPHKKAFGISAFEYCCKNPRFNEVFNKSMSNHTTVTMKKILETYNGFEGLQDLVDVGGGIGIALNMIISKYPQIKGINLDLPHVVASAPHYSGIKHVEGDMFVSVPRGEAILMKWVLHNWSDELCLKILKNCYEALPDTGKVIVVESILPVAPDTNRATKNVFHLDLLMFACIEGGRERTEKEFEALAKGAGFVGVRLVCLACNSWLMEFYK